MTTVTINPSASNHDAWQDAAGAVTLTGEVRVSAGTAWAGLFLPSVAVPAGTTITSATLYYKATSGVHDDPDVDWYAQAADTAAVFTTTASSISSRSRTTAKTQDTAVGIGTANWHAVDVTAPLQEVFSRGGWASGNNAALIGDGRSGSSEIWLGSYDGGGGIVWYVEIVYSAFSPAVFMRHYQNMRSSD